WVKSAVLSARSSLPVFPDNQTFEASVGMSQTCQLRTHAAQQCVVIRSPHRPGRAVPGIFLARRSILTRSGPARAQLATKNDNYQYDAARRAAAARKRSIARPSSRKTASTILNEIQQF